MTSEYFDNWHANNTRSPARDEIHRRHLGLPPYMTSDSLLPWEGIAEVTEALRLKPGETLLDLACGRGAYGLEIARRTDARLIGIDFAESAVQAARALAASLGQDADFRVADMTGTGLAQGSVDAVLSVDSAQFGGDGVFVELRKLLVPGGRVALTGWEAFLAALSEGLQDRHRFNEACVKHPSEHGQVPPGPQVPSEACRREGPGLRSAP